MQQISTQQMESISGGVTNPIMVSCQTAEVTKYLVNTLYTDDEITLNGMINTVLSGMTNGVLFRAIINTATGVETDAYSGPISLAIGVIVGMKTGIANSKVYSSESA